MSRGGEVIENLEAPLFGDRLVVARSEGLRIRATRDGGLTSIHIDGGSGGRVSVGVLMAHLDGIAIGQVALSRRRLGRVDFGGPG
jgi:hypothetical protein